MTTCPRCGAPLNTPVAANALSRVDNQTYICSSCGTNEGMFNFDHPGETLPPLNQPVYG